MKTRIAIAAALALAYGGQAISQVVTSAAAQQALLASPDPKLAANKKLVYDMYRAIVQGGHWEMAEQFFTPEYIQHNPNVASGRDKLVEFIKGSRPQRPMEPIVTLPILDIIAEKDIVMVMSQRPVLEPSGEKYITTWFDTYRIVDGKISEHWDPALKSPDMLKFDPNKLPK